MTQPEEVREFLVNLPVEQYGEIVADVETIRRQRVNAELEAEPKPVASDRDGVARWLAKRHLATDPSLVEVIYLREDSPHDELHFVEVNRLLLLPIPAGERLAALDFGVDVDGFSYSLFVVDVTPEQLDLVKEGSLLLPSGWSLKGHLCFRRG